MPNPSTKPKPDKHKEAQPPASSELIAQQTKTPTPGKPIAILRERQIPFEEERPPNFSPHFEIRVHRVRRREKPQEAQR